MPRKTQSSRSKITRKERITPRKRLAPDERRAQIMDAAARLIVKQGYLPLSMEHLAREAGTSKALVYAYFATQYDLFNALITRELTGLATSGLDTASRVENLEQAAVLCAMLYFEYVGKAGPLLHVLLADRYMSGHVDKRSLDERRKILERLVKLAKRTLTLPEDELWAAMAMMIAIPEEAGNLVFHRELEPSVAREICHRLILSSLDALRAPDRAIAIATNQLP